MSTPLAPVLFPPPPETIFGRKRKLNVLLLFGGMERDVERGAPLQSCKEKPRITLDFLPSEIASSLKCEANQRRSEGTTERDRVGKEAKEASG